MSNVNRSPIARRAGQPNGSRPTGIQRSNAMRRAGPYTSSGIRSASRAGQPNASRQTRLRRANAMRRPISYSTPGPRSAPGAGHIRRRPVANPAAPPVADVLDTRGIQGERSENLGFITETLAAFDIQAAEVDRLAELARTEQARRNELAEDGPGFKPASGEHVASITDLLQNDTLEELLEHNEAAQRMSETMAGIRECWALNRTEWRTRGDKLSNVEEKIKTFKEWLDWPQFGAGGDQQERHRWSLSLALVEEEKKGILQEFQKNKKVLRLLLERFRTLDAEAERLVQRADPMQQGPAVRYELYTDAQDVTQLYWYNDPERGTEWWLEHVVQDMGRRQAALAASFARTAAINTDIQQLIIATKERMEQRKINDAKNESEAEKKLQVIYTALAQNVQGQPINEEEMATQKNDIKYLRDTQLAQLRRENDEDADLLTAYDLRERYGEYVKTLADDFSARYGTVLTLLQNYEEKTMERYPNEPYVLSSLYMMANNLHERSEVMKALGRVAEKTQRRTDMYEMVKSHFEQNPWNPEALQNHTSSQILSICQDELLGLRNLLARLEYAASNLDEASGYDENPRQPSPPPLALSFPQSTGSILWQSSRIKEAKHLLDQAYAVYHKPAGSLRNTGFTWGYQMRAFFDSPDIFPLFRKTKLNQPKAEFHKFVSSLVKGGIPEAITYAWLEYCNYNCVYFSSGILTNRVTVRETGWECCYEKPLAGFERKIPLDSYPLPKRPGGPGLARLEEMFFRQSHLFRPGVSGRARLWDLQRLRECIDEYLPSIPRYGGVYEVQDIDLYLTSWLQRGKFFVRECDVDPDGACNKVIRLDSGWSIPPTTPYPNPPPFPCPPTCTPRFLTRLNCTTAWDVQTLFRSISAYSRTENNLYNILILKQYDASPQLPLQQQSSSSSSSASASFSSGISSFLNRFRIGDTTQNPSLIQREEEGKGEAEGREEWGFTRGDWHLFLRWLSAFPDGGARSCIVLLRSGQIELPPS